jgi:arylsulfatase A-like enzyme
MARKCRPNILFFGIDSLRRDHMSCYGYPFLTSPHFDKVASQGTLFEDSFSPHIPTTPGYANMLTGLDVFGTDRVSLREPGPIMDSVPTLPEILREQGYVSLALGMDDRLCKGFDEYHGFHAAWGAWEDRPLRKAEELNKVALPLLDRLSKGKKPWMLFLRHMDPHSPYLPPAPFDRMFYQGDELDPENKTMKAVWAFKPFADYIRSWLPPGITDKDFVVNLYDGEVAYMDTCIAHLVTKLDDLGIADNTLVVITSDHGETLYDHKCWFDHHSMYDPTLVVPMIFRWPGHVPVGRRVRGMVTLADIVPSMLDIMGWDNVLAKFSFDGRSVWPIERGERVSNYSELFITECTWMRKHGLRTPEWKMIESLEPDFHGFPKRELYNLLEDPLEYNNVAGQEKSMYEALRKRMNAHIERRTRETSRPDPIARWKLGTDLYIGSVAAAQKLQAKEED